MKERWQRWMRQLKDQLTGWIVLILIVMFIVVYLAQRIFISIGPGEGGVLWRRFNGGTQVEQVYGEGMQYIFPWDRMYIYVVRVQQTPHEFDVLTKSGLKIHLLISIRYYPEYQMLGVLHQRVGPEYVQKVVVPEIEAVLRVLIGRLEAEEVYTTERAIIEQSLNYAIEQVAQRYVHIDDVIIKQISMPPIVEQAIQEKIQQKHIALAYLYKIEREKYEKERKQIEAEGFKQFNEILASSISEQILRWRGIQAALELANSPNSKVVVIGGRGTEFQLFGDIPLGGFEESPSSTTVNQPAVLNPSGSSGYPNSSTLLPTPSPETPSAGSEPGQQAVPSPNP